MAHKLGLCWGMFDDISLADFIALAGRHGYQSLMFGPAQWLRPDAPRPGEARRMLAANGVTITSIDGVMASLPRLPPEAQQYALSEDDYLRMAEDLGATCFNVPHYRGDPQTPLQEFVNEFGPFCERAGKLGIAMGLEFLPGTGIPDLQTAWRISEAIGLPNVGVTVDTWHHARGKGTVDGIRRLPAGAIKAFQINDRAADEDTKPDEEMWNRLVPGEGALPLQETIAAVMANNADIGIDAEVFSKDLMRQPNDQTAVRIANALRALGC